MSKKRKILIVTGSRGEYGYIRPVIKLIESDPALEYSVCATNMHLLPEFGNTINLFHEDNIPVDNSVYSALAGYTNASMAKSQGVFLLSFTDIVEKEKPNIILLAGDRGEQLVGAIVGYHMNVPVAHIQAGELSGNVDGMVRHAIARLVHIHFAANRDAKDRLIRTGEQEFRVFNVGAPQVDEIRMGVFASKEDTAKKFNLELDKPVVLVVQHPVTEESASSAEQMEATMGAVIEADMQTVIVYPNNDAGSTAIQQKIEKARTTNMRVVRNMDREYFLGLMNIASVIVGNSSSGILEAPSFGLPAINIGRRQHGRFQGKNVIDVKEFKSADILSMMKKALSKEFCGSLKGMDNPYGDGKSSEKIVETLRTIKIDKNLLFKQMAY